MKNLFKHILFGAAIFAGMGLFVGCDTMTDDEIEKLINDKLNESSSNATADATPPVELAGTTWFAYDEWTGGEYDEDLGEYIEYEVYEEATLSFTETTLSYSSKIYKKEDGSLVKERDLEDVWELFSDGPTNYYVQGNIIITNIPSEEGGGCQLTYFPKEDCILFYSKFYRVEE